MSENRPQGCYVCGAASDLRPYGPAGAPVCFDCMMASPERQAEAKRQFAGRLERSGATALLTPDGPHPAPAIVRKLVDNAQRRRR